MNPRSIRRAAERKAAKIARKQATPHVSTQNPEQGEGQRPSPQHGNDCHPQPCAGKHALTGNFRLLQFESQEAFDELRTLLREEHAPATPTESLLVDRMVEHIWLSQRAGRFQNEAARERKESWFALMLRYQTTHDRGFHRCLAELRTMRREQARVLKQEAARPARQFESQKAGQPYTAEEINRLAPAELHAYVQAAMKRANIALPDCSDDLTLEDAYYDEELRIAKSRRAA